MQSKIPRPNFSSSNQSALASGARQTRIGGGLLSMAELKSFKFREVPAPKVEDEDQEDKFISKMNGLDLELSQTKRLFQFNKPQSS